MKTIIVALEIYRHFLELGIPNISAIETKVFGDGVLTPSPEGIADLLRVVRES